jgi:hypothetical protein
MSTGRRRDGRLSKIKGSIPLISTTIQAVASTPCSYDFKRWFGILARQTVETVSMENRGWKIEDRRWPKRGCNPPSSIIYLRTRQLAT